MGAGVMMVMTVMEIELAVRWLKENNGGERKCTVKKKRDHTRRRCCSRREW